MRRSTVGWFWLTLLKTTAHSPLAPRFWRECKIADTLQQIVHFAKSTFASQKMANWSALPADNECQLNVCGIPAKVFVIVGRELAAIN